MRWPALLPALLLIVPALSCGKRGAESADPPIRLSRPAEGVITLTALDAQISAIESAEGIVVIDTGRSPSLARAARTLIETEFRRDDFAYVVNTHGHPDHTSGNQVFPDAILVGHERCAEFIRQNPADSPAGIAGQKRLLADLRERLSTLDPSSPEAAEVAEKERGAAFLLEDLVGGYRATPPRKTFADRLRLDLGDLTLDLIYAGKSHTEGDILVFVPERRILFTGDLICSEGKFCFPLNAMAEGRRLIRSLEEALEGSSGVETVVLGHAGFLNGAQLAGLRDLLRERYTGAESGGSAARLLEQKIEEIGFQEALEEHLAARRAGSDPGAISEAEFDILAQRLLGRGMAREAVEIIRIALGDLPDSALLHDSLGGAYLRLGEKDLAAESYKRSLELNPYNKNAAAILEEIRGTPGRANAGDQQSPARSLPPAGRSVRPTEI